MITNESATKKQLRTFGIVLSFFLSIIGLINFLKGNPDVPFYLWSFGGATLIIALFSPVIIKPVYRVAMFVAHILGWINTRIILGLIYYFIFTPIALIFKIKGKDPLDRKIDKQAASYWIKRANKIDQNEQYLKQF